MSRPSTTLPAGERLSPTPRRTRTGSKRPVPGRRFRTAALAASILTLPVLLSGCSTDWASMSPSLSVKKPNTESVASISKVTPTATATATANPTATPAVTPTATTDPFAGGELAGGSVKHTQQVGDHSLVISYWTDGDTGEVHLSATLKGADQKHAVKVTRFAASLDSSDGTDLQLADDQGEFVLTPPYSYTSALAVPDATATTTVTRTIDVRFDLLVETAPGSGAFYRQTVLDTVALNSASGSSSSEVVSEGDPK